VITIVRTIELVALMFIIGQPAVLLLRLREGSLSGEVPEWPLEAPALGLALIAIVASTAMAWGVPVGAPVVVMAVVVLVCLAWVLILLRAAGRTQVLHALARIRWEHAGAVVTVAVLLLPFAQDPHVVFWHYAGTDGYFYMRISEHIQALGIRVQPPVDMYGAANGFLSDLLRHYRDQSRLEKPGTMASLALVSSLFGASTLEMASPLNYAACGLLYGATVAFGRSVGLARARAITLGLLIGLAVPTIFLATYTFFANTLSLYIFPASLVLLPALTSYRLAIYAAFLLAGQLLLFPDGTPALACMAIGPVALSLWRAARVGTSTHRLLLLVTTMVSTLVLVAPSAVGLFHSAVERIDDMLAMGPARGESTLALRLLPNRDWIWPAANLHGVPPAPLDTVQIAAALAFAAIGVVFAFRALVRRHLDALMVEAGAYAGVVVMASLTNIFLTGYELFRALAVFAFIPLAVVVRETATLSRARRSRMFGILSVLVIAFVVATDYQQIQSEYMGHFADAQYTEEDLRSRSEMPGIVGTRTVVLGTETPSFTAAVNVVELFSTIRLGVPAYFYPWLFFGEEIPDSRQQLAADLVLVNKRYGEVTARPVNPVYESEDFALVENDLVPFFDQGTFPTFHLYPLAFLRSHNLHVARTLKMETGVVFYSRAARRIAVSLRFLSSDAPNTVRVQTEAGEAMLIVGDGGRTSTATVDIGPGLHTLRFGPLDAPATVTEFHLDVAEQ
jgi:hypothetical protein